MDGRRYSDGLHQAIEAKKKVSKSKMKPNDGVTITFQNYDVQKSLSDDDWYSENGS